MRKFSFTVWNSVKIEEKNVVFQIDSKTIDYLYGKSESKNLGQTFPSILWYLQAFTVLSIVVCIQFPRRANNIRGFYF